MLFTTSTDPPVAGGACIPLKVIGRQFVALASWIIVRSPSQVPGIPHLGSGTLTLDNRSVYWKGTNQALGVWMCMGRLLSAGVMTALVEWEFRTFSDELGGTHWCFFTGLGR